MRCPTCTTEVPPARFCARCGARLGEAGAAAAPSPGATRRLLRAVAQGVSGTGGRAVAVGAGLLVATVVAVGVWVRPDAATVDVDVTLPTEAAGRVAGEAVASPPPFLEFPSATVTCSNFVEHRIGSARLGDADVGDTIEVHGGTCVVTVVDADARPRPYPRGVARGNRPGTGPPGSGR